MNIRKPRYLYCHRKLGPLPKPRLCSATISSALSERLGLPETTISAIVDEVKGGHHLQNEQPTYITTLSEFIEWVDQLGPRKCLFRGLPNQEHSIEASAWRRLTSEQDSNNVDKLLEINEGLIRDARLRGYGKKNGQELHNLEILAELQHFRVSTFLIDFSYSAQVALWFACRESFKDPQNSKELSDGKVSVIFVNPDRIIKVTPELLKENIITFFETDANGRYPLYQWEPGEINSRIPAQYSVFLFGGDRTIEPDKECIIRETDKRVILDSIESFSQTIEATLFPDFDGFTQQRTQYRPYIPEGYESYRAAGYRSSQRGDYKDAISYFDEAINLDSTEADIHYLRGEAKYYLNQFSDAIPDFDKAIDLKKDDLNYYRLRGDARLALNQFEDARDDLKKALELAQQAQQAQQSEDIPLLARIAVLQSTLHTINLQLLTQGDQWTPERFKELVPEDITKHYDSQVGDEELYRLGADLQTLAEEKKWGLGRRFGRSYFAFCFGVKRVFGVNLFRNPRLVIWGTETLESEFSELDHKPTYYPIHRQWVFPRNTTVNSVSEVLEAVYEKVRSGQQIII